MKLKKKSFPFRCKFDSFASCASLKCYWNIDCCCLRLKPDELIIAKIGTKRKLVIVFCAHTAKIIVKY